MTLAIIPFYAALLGLMFVALSLSVIRTRGRYQVTLGGGGIAELERRIRVHGNFAEYAPLTLLLLTLAELRGSAPATLHALGICLVCGRLLHAWGVSQIDENIRIRVAGIILTLSALGGASFVLLLGGR